MGGAVGWTPTCDRIRGYEADGREVRCRRPARRPEPEVLRLNENSGEGHLCESCFKDLSSVLAPWFASSQELTKTVTYGDGNNKRRAAIQGPHSVFSAAEVRAFFETTEGKTLLRTHGITLASRGRPKKEALDLYLKVMARRAKQQTACNEVANV